MVRIIVHVEGMACGMCEAHINEAVRNAFRVKRVTSSHIKKQTVIVTEQNIPEQELRSVIAKAGCDVISIDSGPYEKKEFSLLWWDDAMQIKIRTECSF